MTHQPPIPAGNQSPYPLQEPPHPHHETVARPPREEGAPVNLGVVGALAALGLAALAALGAWAVSEDRARRQHKGKRRES